MHICSKVCLLSEFFFEVGSNFINEFLSIEVLISLDTNVKYSLLHRAGNLDGQILSVESILDGLNDDLFQLLAEVFQFFVAVQLSSVKQSLGPSKDTRN
jgi:hypothetical protein